MTGESLQVSLDWTPNLFRAGTKACKKDIRRRLGVKGFLAVALITGVAIIVGGLALGQVFAGPGYHPKSLNLGFLGGFMMFAFSTYVGIRLISFWNSKSIVSNPVAGPYFSGTWRVQLASEGVQADGPHSRIFYDWRAIVDVVKTKGAIVLSLGNGGFLPLPEEGLPDDMTSNELVRQIAAWRGVENS